MNTSLTREQALELSTLPLPQLTAGAGRLREAAFGRKVDLCAIINARSGNCAMDCRFCSQSRHNSTPIEVFDFLPDDVLRARILTLAALPVGHIGIVTSGAALGGEEFTRLCALLAALPEDVRRRVCVSLGRLADRQFDDLVRAGVRRYHHNLETAKSLYPSICTTQTWAQRRDTVLRATRAGLQACTGGLFGMGETWRERIDFAFSLKELGVCHIPLNFLHPHPQTPLAGQEPLAADEALRIIAVFRHILPEATLRVCGGRPLILGGRQHEIFAAGANAMLTGGYLTTKQGQGVDEDMDMLSAQGLEAAGAGGARLESSAPSEEIRRLDKGTHGGSPAAGGSWADCVRP
ncbi:biotin synthase BioB [Candidatus Desulfovibrio trichonymphae]|uniref:Biotin synthase n=1 Tax=Candidatus Desulfovibrio trichonymphae TaxID=1725232 RepID=A0A1J1E251_9BACT|nr:biotin synthase BioB [Candidatus Desulfovibrio trichonymphae]BAV91947.1 biotin synthase [Candidatus Desulfovibrio trichonymphae]GHU97600.1 biotin synthase [Deltaproteobacteria bacterium]